MDHLLRFISCFEKKSARFTANYQGLQALYSPYPLPPGGAAGVTSGKNQLISGFGVSIYQGFTQETSQLLKKYKNQSHLQPISASCGALPLPVSLPIYTNRQNLALPTGNSPNFEKIAQWPQATGNFFEIWTKKPPNYFCQLLIGQNS